MSHNELPFLSEKIKIYKQEKLMCNLNYEEWIKTELSSGWAKLILNKMVLWKVSSYWNEKNKI